MTRLRVGISTCPNDTYAFHGLLTGEVRVPGVELDIELGDVQELNEGLTAGRYDIAKGSFFAASGLARDIVVLRHGAALGFGVGPVMLARPGWPDDASLAEAKVLVPGRDTTAHLLLRSFHPECEAPRFRVFSEIMPALQAGEADLGVCIHEGRFTYADAGLTLLEDLGARWEVKMRAALPLGGVFARRDLDSSIVRAFDVALGESLRFADEDPDAALPTMRAHAQEFDDVVLRRHVELYVVEATRGLAEDDRAAITGLQALARREGLISSDTPDLVFA